MNHCQRRNLPKERLFGLISPTARQTLFTVHANATASAQLVPISGWENSKKARHQTSIFPSLKSSHQQQQLSLSQANHLTKEERQPSIDRQLYTKDQSTHNTMDSNSTNIPQHFICPLTLEVMKNPMENIKTGHNYERSAILEWMHSGNATCPLTREKLRPFYLVHNEALKDEIVEWNEGHQRLSQIVSFQFLESNNNGDGENEQAAQQKMNQLMDTRNRFLARRAEKLKARLNRHHNAAYRVLTG